MQVASDLLESIKKNGARKMVLVVTFLVALLILGLAKRLYSRDLAGCFDSLCYAAFFANAAEHFTNRMKKNDAAKHDSQSGQA